jgi:hypothetical protein
MDFEDQQSESIGEYLDLLIRHAVKVPFPTPASESRNGSPQSHLRALAAKVVIQDQDPAIRQQSDQFAHDIITKIWLGIRKESKGRNQFELATFEYGLACQICVQQLDLRQVVFCHLQHGLRYIDSYGRIDARFEELENSPGSASKIE